MGEPRANIIWWKNTEFSGSEFRTVWDNFLIYIDFWIVPAY